MSLCNKTLKITLIVFPSPRSSLLVCWWRQHCCQIPAPLLNIFFNTGLSADLIMPFTSPANNISWHMEDKGLMLPSAKVSLLSFCKTTESVHYLLLTKS